MFKKTVFTLVSSLVCFGLSSAFASSEQRTADIIVKHDPAQCPVGAEGHYKISANSDMNVFVTRNSDGNLEIQFQIDGGASGDPIIVDGNFTAVNSVHDDGSSYELGQSAYFCQNSAIYSKFISNDESQVESNITKMTPVPQGMQVQKIVPLSNDIKIWPRAN